MDKAEQVLWFGEEESMQIWEKKKAFDDDELYWKGSKMKLENKVSRGCNWSKFTSMRKKVG